MNTECTPIGQRNTRQRNQILEILRRAVKPISAEAIHERLKHRNCRISLSTVYRTLQILASACAVHRISSVESKRGLYTMHHENCHTHILICRECKHEELLQECLVNDRAGTLVNGSFLVECHHLELRGICGRCRSKKNHHNGNSVRA